MPVKEVELSVVTKSLSWSFLAVLPKAAIFLFATLLSCGSAFAHPNSLAQTTAYLNRATEGFRGSDYVTCDHQKYQDRATFTNVFKDVAGKVWAYSIVHYTRSNARGVQISRRREILKARLDHISRIVVARPLGNNPCSETGYRAFELYCNVGLKCVDKVTISKSRKARRRSASVLKVWLPRDIGHRIAGKFERALEQVISISKGDG